MAKATLAALAVSFACLALGSPGARADDPPARKAPRAAVQALGEAYRAYLAGEYANALALADKIAANRLENPDYALYVEAQSAYLLGRYKRALGHFRALGKRSGSRFSAIAPWRAADCLWHLGQYAKARAAYADLLGRPGKAKDDADVALARYRVAEADDRTGARARARAGFKQLLLEHPSHPLAERARARLVEIGGPEAARLSAAERIARAGVMTEEHAWHEAVAELALVDTSDGDARTARDRDYALATALFKMRRRYKDASDLFLDVYKDMGGQAARALFHGARALSRADFDDQAIVLYQRVVAEYPGSVWAKEAQFLSGWLEFNMGRFEAAIPHLEKMLERYPKARYATDARWFLGFALYRLGRHEEALVHFDILARESDRLEGGKGRYFRARSLAALGRADDANRGYAALVERYPFSWYAHLARARLAEAGVAVDPFGKKPGAADGRDDKVPRIDVDVDESLASDPLIERADELLDAGLPVEAGIELRRGEKSFIQRVSQGGKRGKRGKAGSRASALAMLMDRYRRAGNYNRPWMLAVVYGGHRALDARPEGQARIWWQYAYPLAYRELIERWRRLGENPTYYLYAIMRKESGFDPHTLSYADAIGLLQMIPQTTRRVAQALDVAYTEDLLYDPELNIRTGSWYIGRLLGKFGGQVPLGAGSFNSGPRPVMRWIDQFGDLPMDEFVETVPYRQTREYMKKVTETYSRYLYLYEGIVYDQPLVVSRTYLQNDIDY